MADSMTLEEALAASETSDTTSALLCIIDPDTRKIDIPDARKLLGVESDEEVERVYFKCPTVVGDGIDLSALTLRVNFRNANGDLDMYVVEDMESDGTYITFSWVLGRKVTMYKGTVGFVVCAVSVQDDGTVKNEWNTALNTDCYVLEGLEVTEDVIEESDPEVIEWIVANFDSVVNAAAAASQSAEDAENAAQSAADAKNDMEEIVKSADDVESDINKAVTAANEAAEAANKSSKDADEAEEERKANENARAEAETKREEASATAVQNCKDATAALIAAENRIAFELDSADNGLNIIIYEEVA